MCPPLDKSRECSVQARSQIFGKYTIFYLLHGGIWGLGMNFGHGVGMPSGSTTPTSLASLGGQLTNGGAATINSAGQIRWTRK
jgi:hypothetical protein